MKIEKSREKLLLKAVFILIFHIMANTLPAQIPQVAKGTIKHISNFSSRFVAARNIDIWLPENYNDQHQYAVLYMQDGRALFDSSIMWNHQEWGVDEVVSALLASGAIQDCIIVGIWNGEAYRHNEYFPQKPFESLSTEQQKTIFASARGNGHSIFKTDTLLSDNYLRFMVHELKPYIDSHFSVYTDQAHTFVAGSSMGGLISLYAICEYPDVFAGAACLSTHWTGIFTADNNPIPGAFMKYLSAHLPSPANHKLYFDHGTATLDALYPPFQLQVDAIVQAKGYTTQNSMSKEFPGEEHSEKAWHKRLDIPLLFLLGKQQK